MTDPASGDQAFLAGDNHQTWHEMTYGGALSFARRRYSRVLDEVDVVVSGIPYDCAVTNRSGCRLGPRAIRAGSTQLAELKHFPFGFNPFDHLSVIDYGDCWRSDYTTFIRKTSRSREGSPQAVRAFVF